MYFVLILYLSLCPNQINKTMQNVSIFIQLFGAVIYSAFIFNVIKLIINQLKSI